MENKEKNNQSKIDGMELSILDEPPAAPQKFKRKEISEEVYTPEPSYPYPEYTPQEPPRENYQNYNQQQEVYPQETYDTYAPSYDSETMIEIAEQVFMEKIKKIEKQVDEINEFKTLAQVKIDNISDRLKRMETIIDNLQITILEKVGSYGKDLETTKKEMTMMQDSFRKIINTPKEQETSEFIQTKTKKKK